MWGRNMFNLNLLHNKIIDLIDYLTISTVKPNDLSRFLMLSTFDFISPESVYIAKVNNEGVISPVDGFGFDLNKYREYLNFPLNCELPICKSIRDNQIILVPNLEIWDREYSDKFNLPKTGKWQSIVSFPVRKNGLPIGAVIVMGTEQFYFDDYLYDFIRTISSVVSLQISRIPDGCFGSIEFNDSTNLDTKYLTKRQMQILAQMAAERTNAEIAKLLGFSESTIRHETMRIYNSLNVRGRKEAVHFAVERKLIS